MAVTGPNGQLLTAPADFDATCMETRAGFILLGLLIGLEVVMGFSAVTGWWLSKDVGRQRKEVGGAGSLEMGPGFEAVTVKHG